MILVYFVNLIVENKQTPFVCQVITGISDRINQITIVIEVISFLALCK